MTQVTKGYPCRLFFCDALTVERLWSPISPYLLFVQAGIQGIEPGY